VSSAKLSPRKRERAVIHAFLIVFVLAGAFGGLLAIL
jgi:hypothetical protein